MLHTDSNNNDMYMTRDEVLDNALPPPPEQAEISIDDYLNKKSGPVSHNGGTFESKNEALEYVYSTQSYFERNLTVIGIDVNFKGVAHPFKDENFNKLLVKFDTSRSILISFASLEDRSCSLHWRFKNSRNFISLYIDSDEMMIVDFVRQFLLNSLKHSHNGESMGVVMNF